jgi:hypothetical protein
MPIVGTCGNCLGPVATPEIWGGIDPPVPTCRRCGSTVANPYGPVMPMNPKPEPTYHGAKQSAREWFEAIRPHLEFESRFKRTF